MTQLCLTQAKHASALGFRTYSSLCLLLTPSLLSRSRFKVISVEAFFRPLCMPPSSFPRTPLSVSSQHLQSCDHAYSHFYFLSAPMLPENLLHEGRAFSALFTAISPAPRTDLVLHEYLLSLGLSILSSQGWSVIWFYGCYFIPFCLSRWEIDIISSWPTRLLSNLEG